MGKVTFKLERDNRPLIEVFDKNKMKEKFFHRQYAMAIRCIARYLEEEKLASQDNEFESYTDGNNNLFAFVGDRGTGKTSCMLSVANSLVNKKEHAFEQDIINETDFFTIGLLDPSYFDSEHDILMLFVAKLYSLFSAKAKDINPDVDNYSQKMQLLKDFSATQNHIHSLLQEADKVEGDEFERLTSYAAAIDLKKDINKLIDDYRKFIEKPKGVMLLMVDDIDLNTSEASRMAELLRKYFVHPHTIVLISVKLDQLSYIKKLDLVKEFDKILTSGMEPQEIDEMAERYLSKFMPQEHRIFLPTPELYFDDELTIEYNGKPRKFCSVMQAIPELIYQKTRYLFYNFDGEPSYIIPRNLRDLRQLLKVLAEMEGELDHFDQELADDVKKRNRKVFQNYLYEDWVVNNLDNDTAKQVKSIVEAEGANQLNNAIIQVLRYRYEQDLRYSGIDDVDNIISSTNQAFNISLGDVMGLLNILSNKMVKTSDKKFIFIVSTILSLKLYEYEAELNNPAVEENPQEVKPNRNMDASNNYFKLIGGRLINSNLMELLPRKKENALSRSTRKISRKSVEDLIQTINNRLEKDYRALELLMLCTFRTASTRADGTYRSERRVVSRDFQGGSDFWFEIGSLFNNILDKDGCYKRFADLGGVFENIVNAIKAGGEGVHTLYGLLTPEVCKHMSFRSMDLLQYFISSIGNVHYTNIAAPFTVICHFLTKVGEFTFTTYKPSNADNLEGNKTEVKFDCMNTVFNFANDEDLKNQFNSLFGDEESSVEAESGIAQENRGQERAQNNQGEIGQEQREEVQDNQENVGEHVENPLAAPEQ